MRRRRLALALGIALTSCAVQPPQPPASATVESTETDELELAEPEPSAFAWQREFKASTTARSYAVLTRDAQLWQSPDAATPLVSMTATLFPPHGAVQVLGQVGELVEVALDWMPATGTAHCQPPLYPLALRVFVREDQLADVVTQAQVIDFGDGTGLNVAPGVLVESSSDGLRLSASSIWPQGEVDVVVPAAVDLTVGKIYTPVRNFGASVVGPIEDGVVRVGTASHDYAEGGTVFARSEHDPSHVLYGVDCLQIAGFHEAVPGHTPVSEIADPLTALQPTASDLHGAIGKGGAQWHFEHLYEIPVGAELSWPDGSPAGTPVRNFWIQYKPIRRGSRRCFEMHLEPYRHFGQPASGIEFCVAAKHAKFIG